MIYWELLHRERSRHQHCRNSKGHSITNNFSSNQALRLAVAGRVTLNLKVNFLVITIYFSPFELTHFHVFSCGSKIWSWDYIIIAFCSHYMNWFELYFYIIVTESILFIALISCTAPFNPPVIMEGHTNY